MQIVVHDPPLGNLHDRDESGETPFLSAAKSMGIGNEGWIGPIAIRRNNCKKLAQIEEFLYLLLNQGCSVQDSNLYVEIDRPEEFDQLLYDTVLAAAIPHASYQMVPRLIAEGADIYARPEGWHGRMPICKGGRVTAMHIASIYWNLEGMQALIDHPGEPGAAKMVAIVDDAGQTPLHWALRGERVDRSMDDKNDQDEIIAHIIRATDLLINANPDTVNMRDNTGSTVFNYALMSYVASESIISVIKLLLSARPLPYIINARDNMGDTA
ncbi:hypothetical protein N7520_011947 [Penicillium odoratum]|uniref:uncharacterized protein n=1 Tax=Penicillium odoratum TaxID=1167516 RepID=UPI0025467BE8|nr:uncharacterized protein N7520_011947 [Penicillium odoratum]KAJ5746765.1 hypothetical protein N7520_011947 [Penicillium odoratum]